MFDFFGTKGPILAGGTVELRLPVRRDLAQWQMLRTQSRAELSAFEPKWAAYELTRPAFNARVKQAKALAVSEQAFQFFIFKRTAAQMLGGITLGNIRRGAAQTGEIGYWLGTMHYGQGFMRDAVTTVLEFAFNTLHLHRVEAACIQENARSIALLQYCRFQHEGTARAYLEINGRRQDHHLYARLRTDV